MFAEPRDLVREAFKEDSRRGDKERVLRMEDSLGGDDQSSTIHLHERMVSKTLFRISFQIVVASFVAPLKIMTFLSFQINQKMKLGRRVHALLMTRNWKEDDHQVVSNSLICIYGFQSNCRKVIAISI